MPKLYFKTATKISVFVDTATNVDIYVVAGNRTKAVNLIEGQNVAV